jgi:putative tryptophan/tyrosine transport system substrate-binding protein
VEAAHRAAAHLGIVVQPVEVRSMDDFGPAFIFIGKTHQQGAVLASDGFFYANRGRIAQFALDNKLPLIAQAKEMSEAGALMSYGPDVPAYFRQAAAYVDKILRGAKPADLPVQQPTRFEWVINAKTAKALGLDLPEALLTRADVVID